MAREYFRKTYKFTCPKCGHVQYAAPSIMMTSFGLNMGGGGCLQCKAYLHLEITPDLAGEEMIAIDHKEWSEDMFKNGAPRVKDQNHENG